MRISLDSGVASLRMRMPWPASSGRHTSPKAHVHSGACNFKSCMTPKIGVLEGGCFGRGLFIFDTRNRENHGNGPTRSKFENSPLLHTLNVSLSWNRENHENRSFENNPFLLFLFLFFSLSLSLYLSLLPLALWLPYCQACSRPRDVPSCARHLFVGLRCQALVTCLELSCLQPNWHALDSSLQRSCRENNP